jgi:hypothetical protein
MIIDRQKILPPTVDTVNFYGSSVEVDGMQAIVGADNAAFILVRRGGAWIQEATLLNDVSFSSFGGAVSIHGSIAVVSARTESTDGPEFGAAYVFEKQNNSVWSKRARLTANGAVENQHFGKSVSISGDTVVIGAPGRPPNSNVVGSAYVFRRQNSGWFPEKKLTADNGFVATDFGSAVSISSDIIAIGARYDAEEGLKSGAGYVYSRVGSQWMLENGGKLLGGVPGAEFGNAISISAETVVVGAIVNSNGSAHVFSKDGSGWPLRQVLTPISLNNSEVDQKFGVAVSIDGNGIAVSCSTTVIGVPKDVATYWFTREQGETNWTFRERITAGTKFVQAEADDIVSISGCTIFQGTKSDQQADQQALLTPGAAHAYLLSEGCPCTERPPGMIAWWNMNQPSSPALEAVNGNDATWIGQIVPIQGLVKGGLQFDVNAHLQVDSHPSLNIAGANGFTIDMWVKPIKLFTPRETLIAKGVFPVGTSGYSLHLLNGHLSFELGDGVNTFIFVAQDSLLLDQWAFVAVTIEPAENAAIIYVNGIKIDGVPLGPNAFGNFDTDNPLLIGKGNDPSDQFIGIIDEVEIFNRALGAGELFKIYASLTGGKCPPCTPPPSEMLAWWTFDDLSGGTAIDRIGVNHGSLIGQPLEVPGIVGNSISFSSPDQRVSVAHNQTLEFGLNGLTIDCWVRLDEPSEGFGVLVEKWDEALGVGFRLIHRSRFLIFAYGDGNLAQQFDYIADVDSRLPLHHWTFVAVTVDPSKNIGQVYLDGEPTQNVEFSLNLAAPAGISNAADLQIGGNRNGENLMGRLDELEIFERALKHDEIHEIYNAREMGKCHDSLASTSLNGSSKYKDNSFMTV